MTGTETPVGFRESSDSDSIKSAGRSFFCRLLFCDLQLPATVRLQRDFKLCSDLIWCKRQDSRISDVSMDQHF